MTVFKPKSRMISVRLSEEEYSALRQLCDTTGARSVSDLTRDAMRALLDSPSRKNQLGKHLEDFQARINQLDRKVEALSEKLASSERHQES